MTANLRQLERTHATQMNCGVGMTRVLIADDHAVVRTGLRLLLHSAPDISVVGEADSGEAACQGYIELVPDVVIMDIIMPGIGGIEALRRIRARDPGARVLALSSDDDPTHARRALRAGALGIFSKRSAPEALIEAVVGVAAGKRHIDPGVAQELALASCDGGAQCPIERLSKREFDVFIRLARGASVRRIAEDLRLSASTVGTHLYNVKERLGVSNQSELTLVAIRQGLIEP
jgi:two-component system, NarL family, invasion response regulator UvrY